MENILRIIVLSLLSILILLVIIFIGSRPELITTFTSTSTVTPTPTASETSAPTITLIPPSATWSMESTPTLEPIRIAVAIALNGDSSSIGQVQRRGVDVAQSFFNKPNQDGVNGRDIKLIAHDTEDEVEPAVAIFEDLIKDDGLLAIIGPTYSTQAFMVDPLAEKASIPVIAPSNTAQGIPQIGDYVFRVSAGVNKRTEYSISEALRQNRDIEGVATIYDELDKFSTSENNAFMEKIKKKGLSLLTTQTFTTGTKIFTSQINRILDSEPDLVTVSALENEGPLIVKQLQEAGYDGLIIRGDSLNTPRILEKCEGYCEGMIMAAFYHHEFDDSGFVEAYRAVYDEDPSQYAALMFTAVQVIVEALREEDHLSSIQGVALPELRERLKERLQSEMKFQTPLGEIYFDSEGEVHQEALRTSQIINGEIQVVE